MIEDSSDLFWYYGAIKSSLNTVLINLDIGPDQTRVALGTFGVHSATKQWDLDRYKVINIMYLDSSSSSSSSSFRKRS